MTRQMDNTAFRIQRSLISQWDEVTRCVARLNNSTDVVPTDPHQIFQYSESNDDISVFDLAPILLNVPERAYDPRNDLYVVVRGRISIDRRHFNSTRELRTVSFASEAGYFRLKAGNALVHVYGAHYDLAINEVGHPVFHAHMKSFVEFCEIIKTHYEWPDLVVTNGMDKILKTVRLPTAQMDVFSFLLQVIADHLLGNQSSDDERGYFSELISKNKKIQGSGYCVERLHASPAIECYRAAHWYPE